MFEYYLGEQSKDGKKWRLSITQISDTGYFKNKENGSAQTKTSSYASPEESETRLLFYLSVAPNSDEFVWCPNDIINNYAGCAELGEIYFKIIESEGKNQVVYSVPLSKFIDEEHTLEILRGFIEYCNNNTGSALKIEE